MFTWRAGRMLERPTRLLQPDFGLCCFHELLGQVAATENCKSAGHHVLEMLHHSMAVLQILPNFDQTGSVVLLGTWPVKALIPHGQIVSSTISRPSQSLHTTNICRSGSKQLGTRSI